MAKERSLYRLNERFVSNITGDIIFRQGLRNALDNKYFSSDLPTPARRNTQLLREEKIIKREQRAIETLINNYFAKKRVFYRLNERFASNITGDIIFSARSLERFRQ